MSKRTLTNKEILDLIGEDENSEEIIGNLMSQPVSINMGDSVSALDVYGIRMEQAPTIIANVAARNNLRNELRQKLENLI